jgi:hypothetical protein
VIPIAIVVLALTAWFERPVNLGVVVAVALFVINVATAGLQHHWEAWIAGNGKKIEERLDKMRNGRVMKHPAAWIAVDRTDGSHSRRQSSTRSSSSLPPVRLAVSRSASAGS